MKWLRWDDSKPWHIWPRGDRTVCGLVVGRDSIATDRPPPQGFVCGNCLAHLRTIERFIREFRASQKGGAP